MPVDFMDVRDGNRKRQALIQKLMAQAQGNSANQQAIANLLGSRMGASGGRGVRAMPLFGGGRTGRNAIDLPAAPIPQLTVPFPISPQRVNELGPGGYGVPAAGESSLAPGVPASDAINRILFRTIGGGEPVQPSSFFPQLPVEPRGPEGQLQPHYSSGMLPGNPAKAQPGAAIRHLLGAVYPKPRPTPRRANVYIPPNR